MPVAQSIWIGFDPREVDGFAVTRKSILRRINLPIPVKGIVLHEVRSEGLYTRPTSRIGGKIETGRLDRKKFERRIKDNGVAAAPRKGTEREDAVLR